MLFNTVAHAAPRRSTLTRAATALISSALLILAGCGGEAETEVAETAETQVEEVAEWQVLYDAENPSLANWNTIGDANWTIAEDGAVEATEGNGYLVTPDNYTDFELRVEFWADEPANSGVFIRCSDPTVINQDNAYEVNIYDQRPDPAYATGSIVTIASPAQVMTAANQWNTFEITAEGSHLNIVMNGVETVDIEHDGYKEGPIGLQHGAGTIRFRSVQIRPL